MMSTCSVNYCMVNYFKPVKICVNVTPVTTSISRLVHTVHRDEANTNTESNVWSIRYRVERFTTYLLNHTNSLIPLIHSHMLVY